MAYLPNTYRLIGVLKSANLNITTDQAIPVAQGFAKYVIDKIVATNASADLSISIAAGGLYTAASKGGTLIVGTGQLYTTLTAATKFVALTLALTADSITSQTLYFSLTIAHGSAATVDLYVYGYPLN